LKKKSYNKWWIFGGSKFKQSTISWKEIDLVKYGQDPPEIVAVKGADGKPNADITPFNVPIEDISEGSIINNL
jgi:hypothetical protein